MGDKIVKLKTLKPKDKFRRPGGTFVYEVTEERIDQGCGNGKIWCLNPDGAEKRGSANPIIHSFNEDVVVVETALRECCYPQPNSNTLIAEIDTKEGDVLIIKYSNGSAFKYPIRSGITGVVVELEKDPWIDVTDELTPDWIQSQRSDGKYAVLKYKGKIAIQFASSNIRSDPAGRIVSANFKMKDVGACSFRVYYKEE